MSDSVYNKLKYSCEAVITLGEFIAIAVRGVLTDPDQSKLT